MKATIFGQKGYFETVKKMGKIRMDSEKSINSFDMKKDRLCDY